MFDRGAVASREIHYARNTRVGRRLLTLSTVVLVLPGCVSLKRVAPADLQPGPTVRVDFVEPTTILLVDREGETSLDRVLPKISRLDGRVGRVVQDTMWLKDFQETPDVLTRPNPGEMAVVVLGPTVTISRSRANPAAALMFLVLMGIAIFALSNFEYSM